jgi:hypothetical protein
VTYESKENCEDQRHQERLKNHPRRAEQSLLVTQLHIAPDEKKEYFAVRPDFSKINSHP